MGTRFPAVNPPPPSSGVVPCLYCGDALDVSKGFEQIIGLRAPSGKITVAEPTGRWACPVCVQRLEAGKHPLKG